MEHAHEPPTNPENAAGHNLPTQNPHPAPLVSNSSSANPSEASSDPDAGNQHSDRMVSRSQIGQDAENSANGARDQADSQLQPHFLDTLDTSIMDLPTLACAVSLRLTFPEKVRLVYRTQAAPDVPSQQSLDVLGSS
jgi:hypothetical protein